MEVSRLLWQQCNGSVATAVAAMQRWQRGCCGSNVAALLTMGGQRYGCGGDVANVGGTGSNAGRRGS
jgi:hypothetical protein